MTPLLKLNKLQPIGVHWKENDGTFHFIPETVSIRDEIPDEVWAGYLTDPDCGFSIDADFDSRLNPVSEVITIRKEMIEGWKRINEYENGTGEVRFHSLGDGPGRHSIRGLYRQWVQELDERKMWSKSLLDRILVVYAIERAMNGDKVAINKIIEAYMARAIAIANRLVINNNLFAEKEDLLQDAVAILGRLIAGLSPDCFIRSLVEDGDLPRSVWIENFYINYLTDYVPKELDKLLKAGKNILLDIEATILLDPYTPLNDFTRSGLTPKRIARFNSYCFRPNKQITLGMWLFGARRIPKKGQTSGFLLGRFNQLLRDKVKERLSDSRRWNEEWHLKSESEQDETDPVQEIPDAYLNPLEALEENDMAALLAKSGISRRNVDIYRKIKSGCREVDIAKEYGLSTRHIRRIKNSVSLYLPKE